ncbi:MAG: hypothetical protein HY270_02775 [Deltaproteobacteria bacterium]|nr:hypothetical protein [Deltaproteobacteria bacterium]
MAILWTAGCGKPGVSGVVLPTKEDKTGIPGQQRIEVRLIRGRLMNDLADLAVKMRQDSVNEALQRSLDATKAERETKAADSQKARAALVEMSALGEAAGEGAAALRACLPVAEEHLADAKLEYRKVLTELAPRLVTLGIVTDSPQQAVSELRRALQVKIDTEARQLRDTYIRTALVQKSGTVLATGVGMDRLCWNIENKRDLGVRFRDLVVSYNGKALPNTIAQQIWGLPSKETPLRIPNVHGPSDVLLPGNSFETCFYARGTQLPLEISEAYGFSTGGATRAGEWTLQWQEILLLRDPTASEGGSAANERRATETPLTSVFADQLRQFETAAAESKLIDALNNSDSARAVRQAEATLLACHRAIEMQMRVDEVEGVIQAIESGKKGDFAVEARVRPIMQQILRDPERLTRWIDVASTFIDNRAVARQDMALGDSFNFTDLQPGTYTLLGQFPVETDNAKIWLAVLDVEGAVTQNLTTGIVRNTPLRGLLEPIWLAAGR